jgi:hypothetical protein
MEPQFYVLLERNEKQRLAHYERTEQQIIAQFGLKAWNEKRVLMGYRNGKAVFCNIVPSIAKQLHAERIARLDLKPIK